MKKLCLCLMMVLCMIFASCGQPQMMNEATEVFKLEFLDVGKADSIVLQSGDKTAMIDCGETKDGKDIVKYLENKGVTEIEYLIITHFDQDHVGGCPKILKKINVKNIICPDYVGNNSEYKSYTKALKKYNGNLITVTDRKTINLGDVSFEIYPPEKAFYQEGDNDYSLGILAQHGVNRFFFAGDAEEERLIEFLSYGNIESTVLKVPHHGRLNKVTSAFVNKVSPEYAVICSDMETTEQGVTDILEKAGAKTFFTYNGNVSMMSDGKEIFTEVN